MTDNPQLWCNFCSKSSSQVKKLIAGPDVYICNECVEKCYGILTDKTSTKKIKEETKKQNILPSPLEIKNFLDEYVIGQDYAKEVLSVAVYNHYKRIENPIIDGVEIEKSNICVTGASGTGKTILAQTIAKFLNVPFAMADATSLTEAGYVGDDVETIISRLLLAADNDVRKAEKGIIFLDEIDKKRAGGNGGASNRDISGEGVQQALLKLLEGTEVFIPPAGMKKANASELLKINTKNILFIVGGAFVGLDKIVEQTLNKESSRIGFSSPNKKISSRELLTKVEPEHLIQFGIIPELAGRLPVIAPLNELTIEELTRILVEPKNAIVKQFQGLFRIDGISLEFATDALAAIATIAKTKKTNGRALRNVIETALMKTQFKLPDLAKEGVIKIIITKDLIETGNAPTYIYQKKTRKSLDH